MANAEVSPRRLLLVDDEPSILFAMLEYFTAVGYVVDCAEERRKAEELLAQRSYSVVIVDLRLGAEDALGGLDLLARIKRRRAATPVIVLTAYGTPETEREARRLGASDFLHKPRPLAEIARRADELAAGAPGGDPRSAGERPSEATA